MKTMRLTANSIIDKCRQCPATAEPKTDLCIHCQIELAYRVMAAEPDPCTIKCAVCKAPFRFTEARVLRRAKNPMKGNQETPKLCWVCARLHLSAQTTLSPSESLPTLT